MASTHSSKRPNSLYCHFAACPILAAHRVPHPSRPHRDGWVAFLFVIPEGNLLLFVIPHPERSEGGGICFCRFVCHSERVFRARRTPMNSLQSLPPEPFSHILPPLQFFLFVIPQRSGEICFCRFVCHSGICLCPCSSEGAWGFSPTNSRLSKKGL